MLLTGIKTEIFTLGEKIVPFIEAHIPTLTEGDVLVITSKLIALAEKQSAPKKSKEHHILKRSIKVIETPWAYLTLTHEGWGINAGIDESNAHDGLLLMPKNPFKSAEKIRSVLAKKYALSKLGILITDTRSTPLRKGTIGRAVGFAGFIPLKSYKGKKDLFGRKSRITVSNQADALAASAVAVMGEGSEQTPLVLIKNAPITFTCTPLPLKHQNLSIAPPEDIFKYVFKTENP